MSLTDIHTAYNVCVCIYTPIEEQQGKIFGSDFLARGNRRWAAKWRGEDLLVYTILRP